MDLKKYEPTPIQLQYQAQKAFKKLYKNLTESEKKLLKTAITQFNLHRNMNPRDIMKKFDNDLDRKSMLVYGIPYKDNCDRRKKTIQTLVLCDMEKEK